MMTKRIGSLLEKARKSLLLPRNYRRDERVLLAIKPVISHRIGNILIVQELKSMSCELITPEIKEPVLDESKCNAHKIVCAWCGCIILSPGVGSLVTKEVSSPFPSLQLICDRCLCIVLVS